MMKSLPSTCRSPSSMPAKLAGLLLVLLPLVSSLVSSPMKSPRTTSTGSSTNRANFARPRSCRQSTFQDQDKYYTRSSHLGSQKTGEELVDTSISDLLIGNGPGTAAAATKIPKFNDTPTIWESLASSIVTAQDDPRAFVQWVTILRVGIPSLLLASSAKVIYPTLALGLAAIINDSGAFAVISQDSSQYIQNVLTTSGLVFSLLVGQTYYFMYQQQEAIYLALYEEVTMAKSLLEQIGLVSQGRTTLYQRILQCMDLYVREDLTRFNDKEPAELLSARPVDDPLEDILYLTSVGEPSIVYQTVRSLRQARAYRLGALQKKLPSIHMTLLWSLAAIVLSSFPLLGAGAQTIGGAGILTVQSWYLSFIVFGISLTLGVVYELQRPGENGAYNARTVLQVMVAGLEEELTLRLSGDFVLNSAGPTLDLNRSPALLPLETAQEVLQKAPNQSSSTIVDVESTSSDRKDNGNDSDSKTKSEKKGLRSRIKTWAFDLVQNSITKFK